MPKSAAVKKRCASSREVTLNWLSAIFRPLSRQDACDQSVFGKINFDAARMIDRPISPASASATAAFSIAALSTAVFAKVVQRPMMIFSPRLLRQQGQFQNHEVAIAAFRPIAAAVLPNRHGRHKNTKICRAADQTSPLPAPHNTAKPMPILTPMTRSGRNPCAV